MLTIDSDSFLSSNKSKTSTQFEHKLFKVSNDCAFELGLL